MHQEKKSAEPKKVEVLMSVNINSSELHDDGYSSFLQELKNETASDHTEVSTLRLLDCIPNGKSSQIEYALTKNCYATIVFLS
jgi:hypothetical protein